MQHEGYVHGFQIDADHSLHIYRGSLARVEADALVSSDNNYLLAAQGVSRVLANYAGFDVAREREQIVNERRPTLGEVVRTSGGGLPCRYLYHAITIDGDQDTYMDEAALRKLIATLLAQATADGVQSFGMPALGTGGASFELGRASEIIVEELLSRLVDTPIKRVVLALMGDEAEGLFYERLIRSQAERLASFELRRREMKEFDGSEGDPADMARNSHRDRGLSRPRLPLRFEIFLRGVRGLREGVDRLLQLPLRFEIFLQDRFRDSPLENADQARRATVGPPEVTCGLPDGLPDFECLGESNDHSRQAEHPSIEHLAQSECPSSIIASERRADSGRALEAGAEIVEQFPKLIDEARLASLPSGRPKLVDGLSDLILRHADADDIERELLSSPACRGFRGTLKQRLMEFLYLAEDHLKKALGPALFRNKDLRRMASELGADSDLPRDQDELIVVILQSLCFNTLAPPMGIGEYIARLERLLAELGGDSGEHTLTAAAIEAGKVLEQTLKDLLRLYGCFFFGIDFEAELLRRRIVSPRRDGNHVSRLTIGQALEALEQLNSLMNRDTTLRAKWLALGRTADELLPRRLGSEQAAQGFDCRQVLRAIIAARNDSVHTGDTITIAEPDEMIQRIQRLHAFFCTCQAAGVYPDVLRYEGTYENRNGERFVYFLDEKGRERKVRTDDKIDARRHYYCFATNNPIHLRPTLVPKLY